VGADREGLRPSGPEGHPGLRRPFVRLLLDTHVFLWWRAKDGRERAVVRHEPHGRPIVWS